MEGSGGRHGRPVRPGEETRATPPTTLVHQVLRPDRTPAHWTKMDVNKTDCKIMEARKLSANYFHLETKFRRPGLQLISCYAVQNPFLWGRYLLKRDQMKLQLSKTGFGVRERDFFFKSGFDSFERICRTNFDILIDADPQSGISFHTDALTANAANPDTDTDNIRIMIMTKALIGTCSTEPAGAGGGMQVAVCNKAGLKCDQQAFSWS